MSFEHTRNPASFPTQYEEEVLCANWNPLASILAESPVQAQKPVLDGVEVDAFLARLYRCQRS